MKFVKKDAFEVWEYAIKNNTYTDGCETIANFLFDFLEYYKKTILKMDRKKLYSAIEYLFTVNCVHPLLKERPDRDPVEIAQVAVAEARAKLMELEGYEFPEFPEGYPYIDMSKYQ